jgi:hypothetical protein
MPSGACPLGSEADISIHSITSSARAKTAGARDRSSLTKSAVLAGACDSIRLFFCRTGRIQAGAPVMLFRLLRFFVFVVGPVVLVASPARAAPEKVPYTGDSKAGTIVIQSGERSLYLITGKDQALKYTVGVGRSGQQWYGTTRIASKHIKPAWKPPASLRGKRSPDFYIEGGLPQNPMGAAALVLVDHELAIHGTNNPGSIGGLVSAGCIRMHNRDVMDLYGRVHVGTRVVFVK